MKAGAISIDERSMRRAYRDYLHNVLQESTKCRADFLTLDLQACWQDVFQNFKRKLGRPTLQPMFVSRIFSKPLLANIRANRMQFFSDVAFCLDFFAFVSDRLKLFIVGELEFV
jgi:hypothetical protein